MSATTLEGGPYSTEDLAVLVQFMINERSKENGRDDFSRGPSARALAVAIGLDAQLLEMVRNQQIALPLRKSNKTKDPDWLPQLCADVLRLQKGACYRTIERIWTERAVALPDEGARRNRMTAIKNDLAVMQAKPTQIVLAVSRAYDNTEASTQRESDLAIDKIKLEERVDRIERLQLLLLEKFADQPPSPPSRRRSSANDAESPMH